MEWNRAVDCAIVSGVSETDVVELKKAEITDRVKESVEQDGNKPELFGDIVRAAVVLLELLIARVMHEAMDIAEKVVGKAGDAVKESPKETESHIHAKDELVDQAERKKIPLSVNTHQEVATERPPYPKPSVLASKYPRLKEIEGRLKEQNKAIFGREKKRDKLKKELFECIGIFKGGRRKELQQEIDGMNIQISNMKKRLSSIVKEHHFDSVQAFYKELNAAKKENRDYESALAEYEKIYGEKEADTKSIRERLRQKEQIVKEREARRVHRTRQKDKGTR